MSMFSQSLIQGLINPSYADALGTAGMLAGSMPDRLRLEREEREKKMREAQIASMEATATGATEEAARKRAMAQQVLTGQVASAQDPRIAAAAQAGAMRAGVKPTDVVAATGLAQQRREEQARKDAAVVAANRAKVSGVPQEAITALANDPDALNAYATELEGEKRASTVDRQARERQIAVQLGVAKNNNAPPEVIADVQAGAYVDNSGALFDIVQGKGTNIEEYQDQTSGVVNSYPEKNGRLLVNGKWTLPTEANLVKAPSRTAEDSAAKFTPTKSNSAQMTMMGAASGTLIGVINELETIKDARGAILLSAVSPVALDETSTLKAAQNLVPEALGRALSGAAIKNDEMPRFEEMFSIRLMDYTSPVTIATKLVRTAALTSATSRLATGEISANEARSLMEEAGSLTLTDEDKQKLQQGKLKEVVAPYVEQFTGTGKKSTSSAESIFSQYGV